MTLRECFPALLCLLPAFLVGCAHPAAHAISLPTTLAVRVPLVSAQSANARAVQIVARSQRTGLHAGSSDLRELTAALQDTALQLATARAGVDTLTAQLLSAQKRVDAQTGDLAHLTTKYNAAVKSLWHYRLWFWGPLTLALAAAGVVAAARFTAWGARTLGPYLVSAEHLAVRAAVLA